MSEQATDRSGHFHAVRFYDSPDSLCRIVANFLADGLKGHEPALVIATPEHRRGITAALHAQKFDVEALEDRRRSAAARRPRNAGDLHGRWSARREALRGGRRRHHQTRLSRPH